MASDTLGLSKLVKYQLIVDSTFCSQFAWLVFGGDDGSVLVHKARPTKHGPPVWEKLLQCRTKSHGYWCVSLGRVGRSPKKVYAQEIILRAFDRPPRGGEIVAMHLNDDPDDNRPSNLRWGTKQDNQKMRQEHGEASELPGVFLQERAFA